MRGNLMFIEGVPSAVGAPTKYMRKKSLLLSVFHRDGDSSYTSTSIIDGVERLWKVLVKIIMHDRSSVRVFGWCHGDTKNYQPQKEEVQIFLHIDIPCAPLVVTSFLLNQFLVNGN